MSKISSINGLGSNNSTILLMSSIFSESQNSSKASIGSRGRGGVEVVDKSTGCSYGDGVSTVTGNEGDPGVP